MGVQLREHSSKFAGVVIPRPMAAKIVVNGEPRELAAPATVAGMLEQMQLTGRRVAVEVNGEIVPRSEHGTFGLKDQDRVEVVFAIGGGSQVATLRTSSAGHSQSRDVSEVADGSKRGSP